MRVIIIAHHHQGASSLRIIIAHHQCASSLRVIIAHHQGASSGRVIIARRHSAALVCGHPAAAALPLACSLHFGLEHSAFFGLLLWPAALRKRLLRRLRIGDLRIGQARTSQETESRDCTCTPALDLCCCRDMLGPSFSRQGPLPGALLAVHRCRVGGILRMFCYTAKVSGLRVVKFASKGV